MPSLIRNVGFVLLEILHNEMPLVETGRNTVSLLIIIASLKKTCLKKYVPFVVLLHSIYVFVSVSSLVPLISRIALAVLCIDKSKEILDLVAFVYPSMLVLASTNSIGLLTPPPAPATYVPTSPLL